MENVNDVRPEKVGNIESKKAYKRPSLTDYGTISRLTETTGTGAINDGGPGANGRNKST